MFSSVINAYGYNVGLTYYVNCLIVILGLVIGSFLNVVGLRFLSGESIVLPPSKCPKCNTKLKWYDNIPVLSYIMLLGKCRYCKCKISPQYPVIESISGIMFLLIFLKFGFTLATPMLWILLSAGLVMCITDFKEQVIFDAISIPMIPLGLIYSFFNLGKVESSNIPVFNLGFSLPEIFISALIGIAGAFIFFEAVSFVAKLLIKQRAFGEGDTIIAMIFGAWFGWKFALITIVLAFLVQVIFTLPILMIKLFKIKDKIALISFFALIFSAIIPLIVNKFEIFYNGIFSSILLITLLIVAMISALTFLRRMRELNSYTLLPFGPALIVGGFITLFFYENLVNFILI